MCFAIFGEVEGKLRVFEDFTLRYFKRFICSLMFYIQVTCKGEKFLRCISDDVISN